MRRKPVHVFLLHAAFFLALLGVMPGPREIYPRVFHAAGNFALRSMGDGLSVRFYRVDPATRADSADTRMVGRQVGRLEYRWKAVYNSHRRAFWPMAALTALMFATPMSRLRLAAALLLGLLLFNVLFLLQVAALAQVLFGATGSATEASLQAWRRAMPVARAMFNTPITNFSVVFLLWAWLAKPAQGIDLVSLNALLRRLLGPSAARGSPPAPKPSPPADAEPGATPTDDDSSRPGASPRDD